MICAHCTASILESDLCSDCGQYPILHDQYRLDAIVGTGASGTTYRAMVIDDGSVVAIKELLVRKVDSLKAIELFEREAGVLEQLDHPGIPNLYDEFTEDTGRSVSLYLVQEFIDGETLEQEMKRRRFTETDVLDVLLEMFEILHYLHRLHPPVIHRDIKPSNVMRRSNGKLVLIDFGSVRESLDTREGGSTMAGTFGYMAPEQFVGRAVKATDIFGLGQTATTLLTRRPPTESPAIYGASEGLTSLLMEMTTDSLEERPGHARELASRVRSLLTGGYQLARIKPNSPQSALASAMIPAPPRQLPANFNSRRFDLARFQLVFGSVFGGLGIIGGLVPLGLALVSGNPLGLLLGFVLLLVFGGLGSAFFFTGYRRMRLMRHLFQFGEVTTGMITAQTWSNYRVNRQHARVHHYRFMADGRFQQGRVDTFEDYPIAEGEEVAVIFDPRNPSKNTLYPVWD